MSGRDFESLPAPQGKETVMAVDTMGLVREMYGPNYDLHFEIY